MRGIRQAAEKHDRLGNAAFENTQIVGSLGHMEDGIDDVPGALDIGHGDERCAHDELCNDTPAARPRQGSHSGKRASPGS